MVNILNQFKWLICNGYPVGLYGPFRFPVSDQISDIVKTDNRLSKSSISGQICRCTVGLYKQTPETSPTGKRKCAAVSNGLLRSVKVYFSLKIICNIKKISAGFLVFGHTDYPTGFTVSGFLQWSDSRYPAFKIAGYYFLAGKSRIRCINSPK